MRLADQRDQGAIVEALVRLKQYATTYDWATGIDFHRASSSVFLEVELGNAYVIGGYLVLVHKCQPWYSTDYLLQEWLVLKLYAGGSSSMIPSALLGLAKALGCTTVITADSSPINIMAKAYSNAGFTPLTQSFYKRVP